MNPPAYKSGESKLLDRQNQERTLFDGATGLPGIVHFGIPIAVTISLYAAYLWFLLDQGKATKLSIAFGFGGPLTRTGGSLRCHGRDKNGAQCINADVSTIHSMQFARN